MNRNMKNLTTAGICLGLCLMLPFLTGQIPQIGNALSPMHVPVLLCGFIAGPYYAALIGFAAPLLRFMLFGMPPLMPIGVAMCFELAAYGFISGILYRKLPKKIIFIYISLITAMIFGRVIWGIAQTALTVITELPFTTEAFITAAFIIATPGIILHIVLVPIIVITLKKAGFISE